MKLISHLFLMSERKFLSDTDDSADDGVDSSCGGCADKLLEWTYDDGCKLCKNGDISLLCRLRAHLESNKRVTFRDTDDRRDEDDIESIRRKFWSAFLYDHTTH